MIKSIDIPLDKILSEAGLRVSPTYIPHRLTVEVDSEDEILTMRCTYRFARDEEQEEVAAGSLRVCLGVHTRRLFSLVMDVGVLLREAGKGVDVAPLLAESFAVLTRKLEVDAAAGPRKHYSLVEREVKTARPDRDRSVWEWASSALQHTA